MACSWSLLTFFFLFLRKRSKPKAARKILSRQNTHTNVEILHGDGAVPSTSSYESPTPSRASSHATVTTNSTFNTQQQSKYSNVSVIVIFALLSSYEGDSICNEIVPINQNISYLNALQLHSQKDRLLGYATAKSQLSSSFPTLHNPLSRKGTKLYCDTNLNSVFKFRRLYELSVFSVCLSCGEYIYIDD